MGTDDFSDPPIVEMVLGAQFSPLTKLTSGHFGLFWKELGNDWGEPSDWPLIDDQFELFDHPIGRASVGSRIRLEPIRLPGRFALRHMSKDRLLQIQATRFHLNWKKREGFYPSYGHLIAEFEEMFARFSSFAERSGLGTVAVNQWEVTYIDSFAKDRYWSTPADWSLFLPGLFGQQFPTDGLGISLEHRAAESSYEIQPKRGRLHVAAGPGRAEESRVDSLLLQMTARGPVGKGGASTLREGLDLGHEAALNAFLRMVSEDTKKRWGVRS